ncbi:MAG: hypothetical protein MR821_06580 [Clostridiales bacterium]|nr:hypothetical protein [Clostridiales bacterium]
MKSLAGFGAAPQAGLGGSPTIFSWTMHFTKQSGSGARPDGELMMNQRENQKKCFGRRTALAEKEAFQKTGGFQAEAARRGSDY